jgi:hypothetical protein
MPLTTITQQMTAAVTSIAGAALQQNFAPIGIISGIISKMSGKIPLLRRLLRITTQRITFAFMPNYKAFVASIADNPIKARYLFIDFEDYVKTMLTDHEITEFYKFINDKSDNDLYKEIVIEMVNKMFNNDINTGKKVIYFIDNEKIFKLINKRRKIYIYPKTPEDADIKTIYSSITENIRKQVIIYKSFSELVTTIAHRL